MHAFDRQTDRRTDRRTDRQTEISSQDRVCIPCSAVKIAARNWQRKCVESLNQRSVLAPKVYQGLTVVFLNLDSGNMLYIYLPYFTGGGWDVKCAKI